VSLLHFIIFFLLGGLTLAVVGAVQFKQDAGMGELRYHFLAAGALLVVCGLGLLVVKCIWFRVPVASVVLQSVSPEEKENGDGEKEPLRRDNAGELTLSVPGASELAKRRHSSALATAAGQSEPPPLSEADEKKSRRRSEAALADSRIVKHPV